jgi:hypothetical protein
MEESNPEFRVHILNEEGIQSAKDIALLFDTLLNGLKAYVPAGREFSIVKTKLEEASFFAKKGMANSPTYQKA